MWKLTLTYLVLIFTGSACATDGDIDGPLGSDCERLDEPEYVVTTGADAEALGDGPVCVTNRLTIGGDFRDLTALAELREVGELHIVGNDQLTTLDGLDRVEVTDGVAVEDNPVLATLSDAHLALADSLDKGIKLRDNSSLDNLLAFRKVTDVGEDFEYVRNGGLTDLSVFESIRTIDGSFIVSENDDLASVGGFGDLTGVGSDLIIEGNPDLERLNGFSLAFGLVGRNLIIRDNPRLVDYGPFCGALGSIEIEGNGVDVSCEGEPTD